MRVFPDNGPSYLRLLAVYAVLLLLAACAPASNSPDEEARALITEAALPTAANPSIATITPIPIAQQPATAIPTSEMTPSTAMNMTIWWPEPLAPTDRSDVISLLDRQIGGFDLAEGGEINVEFRRKRVQDVGGIMPTLRTANEVAPGALPDVTLIRREDLRSAANAGLIYPLDTGSPAIIDDDIYTAGQMLGTVDGRVYGIPYTLDLSLLAYRAQFDDEGKEIPLSWSFSDILENEREWVFSAGRAAGISSTFFTQYLDAGGTPPDAEGVMTFNPDALQTTLEFYEQARNAGLIDERVFEFTTPADYVSELINGDVEAGIVDSTIFMQLAAEDPSWRAAAIPTASGQPSSTINGWMWVITTPSSERQVLSKRFLNWMLESDRQAEYVVMMGLLPSQRTVMGQLENDLLDYGLINAALTNGRIPLSDGTGGTLPRAMQNALVAVISGQSSAEEATQAIIDQLAE